MTDSHRALESLQACLERIARVSVAVSGGVDSMILSVIAHFTLGGRATMFHAVSPAVPADATERVRRYARREGWRLQVIGAREFDDPRYVRNPVNRCYFCKTNLYRTMTRVTESVLVSGTNLDDLSDFRPGLTAAREYGVRHPYVEVGVDKRGVRGIAAYLGLSDLNELPAAPCLSSRIETGISIDPDTLSIVDTVEKEISRQLDVRTVRCRVRGKAIVIELDADSMSTLTAPRQRTLRNQVASIFRDVGINHPVSFAEYRTGSAFLRR